MITYGKFDKASFVHNLIVTDENLQRLYGIVGDNVYALPCGEQAKSFANAEALCRWFLAKGLTRNGHVVAVGGGSVGDVTGFAASIFMRGVDLTIVPTTLLAMVDSGIGGKTAINLDGVKNVVGSFVPADTFIDVGFLHTLDDEQMLSGMGEITKYRMLGVDVDVADIGGTVRACAEYKQNLCEMDFYDKGLRHALNCGHTIGHALELACDIPHGVAVADGLYYECEIAHAIGLCGDEYRARWQNEIKSHFPLYKVTLSLLKAVKCDKKNVDGNTIGFALPTENGAKNVNLTFDEVAEILC